MKYNKEWLMDRAHSDEAVKYLFFWGHQPTRDGTITKTCLSQWWAAPFEYEKDIYPTAEHWMMAGKARLFQNDDIAKAILDTKQPAKVKELGRQVTGFDPAVWEKERFDIVKKGNYLKFSQHRELKAFLLSTKDRVLVEASPVDPVWGIGLSADDERAAKPWQWKGENLLGFALMEVREQLK